MIKILRAQNNKARFFFVLYPDRSEPAQGGRNDGTVEWWNGGMAESRIGGI